MSQAGDRRLRRATDREWRTTGLISAMDRGRGLYQGEDLITYALDITKWQDPLIDR